MYSCVLGPAPQSHARKSLVSYNSVAHVCKELHATFSMLAMLCPMLCPIPLSTPSSCLNQTRPGFSRRHDSHMRLNTGHALLLAATACRKLRQASNRQVNHYHTATSTGWLAHLSTPLCNSP